jgi:hypothetical protein
MIAPARRPALFITVIYHNARIFFNFALAQGGGKSRRVDAEPQRSVQMSERSFAVKG